MKPERTLATAPEGQRLGLLTHPSWLVSHSDAMDNHAILALALDPRKTSWVADSRSPDHGGRHVTGRTNTSLRERVL